MDRDLRGTTRWRAHVMVSPNGTVRAEPQADGGLRVRLERSTLLLKELDDGVRAALVAAVAHGTTLAELDELASSAGAEPDLSRLGREVSRLWARGALRVQAADGDRALLEVEPTSTLATLDLGPAAQAVAGELRLSRFALLRRAGSRLVLDGLVAHTCSHLVEPYLAFVLVALAREGVDELRVAQSIGCDVGAVSASLALLRAAGVVGAVGDDGLLQEDRRPDLMVREVSDLFLHNRSRSGLTVGGIGGTAPFSGRLAAPPARRSSWPGAQTHLPEPSCPATAGNGMSLIEAMDRRRSWREFGRRPLSLSQLSELLDRVFRMPSPQVRHEQDQVVSARPGRLPNAGDLHDLEVYVAVGRVDGLDRALYHYDPEAHLLTEVSRSAGHLAALLSNAAQMASLREEPPNLLLLASRFGRLAWKYEGIAYALTLKNVGVAYEAVYLTAAAMGLATCALGTGESASFAALTGLPPHLESTVGEMLLGTLPEELP